MPAEITLLDDPGASALLTAAGFAYPASTTGFIRVVVNDGVTLGVEQGATVTLDGSGSPPVYLDGSGQPDLSLTAIGSAAA